MHRNVDIHFINNEFIDLVLHGDINTAEKFMHKKIMRDNNGKTVCHTYGFTLLHLATLLGNNKMIESLLDRDYDINAINMEEDSSLHIAVKNRNINAVKLLVYRGANVNLRNRYSQTPLCHAVHFKKFKIVEILLRGGADVNIVDQNNKTPIMYAMLHSEKIAALLINGIDKDNRINGINENNKRYNIDLNRRYNDGDTLLHRSVLIENTHLTELLISKGLDVNSVNKYGYTPLHYACNLEYAKLLLDNGAEIDAVNNDLATPLYSAIRNKRTDIAMYLIRNGADINAVNLVGNSILYQAILRYDVEFDNTNYIEDDDILQLLFDRKVNVNTTNAEGRTPLNHAVIQKRINLLRRLLDYGVDIDYLEGKNCVHVLNHVNCIHVLKMLVKYGADINVNHNNESLLFRSISRENYDMFIYLLKKGAVFNPTWMAFLLTHRPIHQKMIRILQSYPRVLPLVGICIQIINTNKIDKLWLPPLLFKFPSLGLSCE